MQSRERRLGRLRRRQPRLLALQAPVLRLRQGHRRAERRRHRARARGARPGDRLRRRGPRAGSTGCSREQEADGSWFGRWGVNHVYGTGAALPALEACGIEPGHRRSGVQWHGSTRCRTRTAASARTSAPTPSRAWRGRGTSHAFPNGLGAISLRRCRRGRQRGRPARRRMAMPHTTGKRRLGRGALHRHGLPARLHDPLPPLPAPLPVARPRPSTRKAQLDEVSARLDGPDRASTSRSSSARASAIRSC